MSELKEDCGDNVTHDISDCIMETDVEIKNEPLEDNGMVLWVKKEKDEELGINNKSDDQNQTNQETTYKSKYTLQKSVNKDIDGVLKEELENSADDKEREYCYIKEIRKAIDSVAKLGNFACGGVLENAKLQLNVKGIGSINLPLSSEQGEVLKAKCTAAPFGRGSETLVHKSVRDAWQVDAKDVTLDMEFSKLIKEKLTQVIPNLTGESFSDSNMYNLVEPELYKLVYYEKGGHFLAHRDTEKSPGMFATLVVQLPAGHKGGALVLRHKGDTKVFEFVDNSKDEYFFTAFFADCEHELLEVTSGHRLVLIYNLIRTNPYSTLHPNNDTKPSNNNIFLASMKKSVELWKFDDRGPNFLALKLDHLYTKANISFKNLKGKDRHIADALCSCADINVYLVTLTKIESRRGYDDEPGESEPELCPFEDEIDEASSYTLSNWMGVYDNIKHFGELDLNKNEMLFEEDLFPKDERSINKKDRGKVDEDEDDHEEIKSEYVYKVTEYTGNEGCEMEYFYKKTAIVFFPTSNEIFISCENSLYTNLVTCKELVKTNAEGALELLQTIFLFIEKSHKRAMIQLNERDNVAIIFEIIILFENKIKIVKSLANNLVIALVTPYSLYNEGENVGLPNINSAFPLANLINKLGWESLGTSVLQLVKECAVTHTLPCAQLVSCMLSLGLHAQVSSIVEVVVSQIITKGDVFSSDSWALWAVLMASHDIFSSCFDTIVQKISTRKDKVIIEIVSQMYKSLQPIIINQCKIKKCFQTFLGILKDNRWKSLSVESAILVWPVVLFVDKINHDCSPINSLVQAVIEHKKSCQYIIEILKLCNNVEEKDNPSVKILVQTRLEQLNKFTQPVFSWAQSNATLVSSYSDPVGRSRYSTYCSDSESYYTDSESGSDSESEYFYDRNSHSRYSDFEPSTMLTKDVQNFLRGNQQTKSFGGFEKKRHADQFGKKYFPDGNYNKLGKYSARHEISGVGKKVVCTITKTKNYFEEQNNLYTLMFTEAESLKQKFCLPNKTVAKKRLRK